MDFELNEEQRSFSDQVFRFARQEILPRVREHDLKGEFDRQSWDKLGEYGLLGLHFPEEVGGSGADVVSTVLAAEALGRAGVDGGLILAYGAHTFLCADTIFAHGTDGQNAPNLGSQDCGPAEIGPGTGAPVGFEELEAQMGAHGKVRYNAVHDTEPKVGGRVVGDTDVIRAACKSSGEREVKSPLSLVVPGLARKGNRQKQNYQ